MRLHDVLDYHARERPTTEFAVHGDRRVTYHEALSEVHQLAHALVNAGLQIGDRVAILAKNRLEYLYFYFAASKAGVVPVPLNYRLAPPEWAYILQDAEATLLIAAEEYLPALDEHPGGVDARDTLHRPHRTPARETGGPIARGSPPRRPHLPCAR